MGALACMDLVSRRLQQYTGVHKADVHNWASAKHISSSSSLLELVRGYVRVAPAGKERSSRVCPRGSRRKTVAGVGGAAAAALVGGLRDATGSPGDEGKGKGGRGPGGARPSPQRLWRRGAITHATPTDPRFHRGIGAKESFFCRIFRICLRGLLVVRPADSDADCYGTSTPAAP